MARVKAKQSQAQGIASLAQQAYTNPIAGITDSIATYQANQQKLALEKEKIIESRNQAEMSRQAQDNRDLFNAQKQMAALQANLGSSKNHAEYSANLQAIDTFGEAQGQRFNTPYQTSGGVKEVQLKTPDGYVTRTVNNAVDENQIGLGKNNIAYALDADGNRS